MLILSRCKPEVACVKDSPKAAFQKQHNSALHADFEVKVMKQIPLQFSCPSNT